ncbi:MAG TPA: phosphomethylpyrimidine synthase ThiC, partial [Gemmatimonadales bacterium]|nr:phosphomethylpyrimidine synthase ThiC [Gemmatimonadales bacterium]
MTATLPARPAAESYGESFPRSTKVYTEGSRGIRVPMREISLSEGEPSLRVYDSSGPLGHDPRDGLPAVREAWIGERDVERCHPEPGEVGCLRGRSCVTQLRYARLGQITPEMEFAAIREGVDPELVRSEVARGRA